MACKHRPEKSGFRIKTKYGMFYTIDCVQQCRKCGVRIKMKHKKRYVCGVILSMLICWMFYFLAVSIFEERAIRIGLICGVLAAQYWLFAYSGYAMTWCEVKLSEEEKVVAMKKKRS